MAYQTGSVVGLKNLFDTIVTFITANGWTLHDTLSVVDKVFRSTGTSLKQNHYIRLTIDVKFLDYVSQTANFVVGQTITGGTSGATALIVADADAGTTGTLSLAEVNGTFQSGEIITGTSGSATVSGVIYFNLYKDPRVAENVLDFILIRGYSFWNASTDTGTNEFGKWGPWNLLGPGNLTNTYRVSRPQNLTFADPFLYETDGTAGSVNFGVGMFDGVRKFYAAPQAVATQYIWDMSLAEVTTFATPPNGGLGNSAQSNGCPVWDKVNDRFYFYAVNPTATSADQWKRWNFDTNAWEALASPAAVLPTSFNYARLAWDGADFIYATWGSSSTSFARYSISGNSWTARAALPTSLGSDPYTMYNAGIYVPKGVIPAVTEDVIYFIIENGSTTLRRYNVTSDTWASPITLPQAHVASQSNFWWDYNRYLYFAPNSSFTFAFRLDLQNISGGWTSFQYSDYGPTNYTGVQYVNHFVSKLKGRVGATVKYWLVADADSVTMATKIGTSNYYWAHFGMLDTYYKTQIATLTSPASPGSPTTVNVDSSSGFVVGDKVLVLDPANGRIQPATISSVPSGTQLSLFLGASFATGSRIFVDAINTIVTGDSWLATMGHDVGGFEADRFASSYRIKPLSEVAFSNRAGPTSRDRTQLSPFVAYGNQSNLKSFENRGALRGVFALKNAVFPAPQPEDVVEDANGDQFMVLTQKHAERTPDTRLICIGPIN